MKLYKTLDHPVYQLSDPIRRAEEAAYQRETRALDRLESEVLSAFTEEKGWENLTLQFLRQGMDKKRF